MPQGFYISRRYWIMGIIPIWLLLRTIILLVKKKNNKQIDLKRELIINIFYYLPRIISDHIDF